MQLLDLAMFAALAFTFRLRSKNVYFRLQGVGGAFNGANPLPKPEELVTWAELEEADVPDHSGFEMGAVTEQTPLRPTPGQAG